MISKVILEIIESLLFRLLMKVRDGMSGGPAVDLTPGHDHTDLSA